jgi:CubicO group peptidase (beta-lactamase class C family)
MHLDPELIHSALSGLAPDRCSDTGPGGAFSGAVHISRGPETIYSMASGYAQRGERIPNRADTRFGTASGTKTFTATTVLRLVQEGRIKLESRLAEIVPHELPRLDPSITVQQLLTHTAGNPDYFDEEVPSDYAALWADRPMYRIVAPGDFVPMFRDLPMKFEPGTRFSYSNSGYILLGLVVEAALGLPFCQAVEETVFAPAGMSASGFFRLDQLPGNTAYGYPEPDDDTDSSGSGERTNQYSLPVIGGPDGGAFTTGPDMQRFWNALLQGRLIDPDHTGAMLGPRVSVSPEGGGAAPHYGYGVWVDPSERAGIRAFALGADPGVSFISSLWPQPR